MSGSAVLFGAGNIGRGFLAQLFSESGLEIVFVDAAPRIVEALNSRRSYPLHIVGDGAQTVTIRGIRAHHSAETERVADEVAAAEIVCTAVGAGALPTVATTLADGLLRRWKAGRGPVNILVCENLNDAAARLRGHVAESLPPGDRDAVLAQTGFVQAVVSRMAPALTASERAEDILAVRVEAYKRLPVDANAVVGSLPSVAGIEPTTRFAAAVERKLYSHNCAHAILGYLGSMAGHEFCVEALADARIFSLLRAVLLETSEALIRKHGFSREEQDAHVEDLLARFRNRALGDTCRRLARDPLRKLAPGDRLVGAARLCEQQKVEPRALAWGIVGALRYSDPEDPSANEMQRLLCTLGRDAAIAWICGIGPAEPLAALVREAFNTTEPPQPLPN